MAAKVGQVIVDFLFNTAKFETDIKKATRSLNNMGREFSNAGRTLTMGLTLPLVAAGAAALKLAGDFEQTKIAFNTMLGSTEKSTKFLKDLKDFATKTPFEFKDLTQASKRMMALGFSAEQVIPILTNIGDAVAGLGGGSLMIDRVTLALGQMQAKGKVSAQEMNQLAEAGIPAWQLLANRIGRSIPEAMKLAEKGAIASSIAIPAILAGMNDRFGGLMAQQNKTLLGQLSNLKDQMYFIVTDLGTKLIPIATNVMNNFVKPLAEGIKRMSDWFISLSESEQKTILKFAALAAAMGPALWAIGAMSTGIGTLLPLFSKGIMLLSGGGGFIGSIKNLGVAAGIAGAIFAGWKIAEWIDSLDLFGRHAAVAADAILRQAHASRDQAIALGAVDEAMAKYKQQMDAGIISAGTFKGILNDLIGRRLTETTEQYAARMKALVDQFKAAHPELQKATAGTKAHAEATNTAGFALDFMAEKADKAKSALERQRQEVRDANLRILEFKVSVDRFNPSLIENARMMDEAADSLKRYNEQFSLESFIPKARDVFENANEITGAFERMRKEQDSARESTNNLGNSVSTTLTNMTQTIAREATKWAGPFKDFASAALSALMEGLFNPMTKIITGIGTALGNWLTGLLGGAGASGAGGGFGEILKSIAGGGGLGKTISSILLGTGTGAAGTAGATSAAFGTSGMLAGMSGVSASVGTASATGLTGALGFGGGAGLLGLGALTIPLIGAAITGLAFGVKALVNAIQGPNSWQAMSKEISRDYGGLKVSDKSASSFFKGFGITEKEAWSDRKQLTSSPAFIQYMYSLAQQQGNLGKYLASLGHMAIGKDKVDYLTPFKMGLQSGDWSALNALWAGPVAASNSKLGAKITGGLESLFLPSASGMSAATAASVKTSNGQSPSMVNVRTGDSVLTIHIHGAGNDLVQRVRKEVIPIIMEHLDRGNTGLRESVAHAVRITAGAY
jgi:tape measure domain-containing protein